MDGAAFIGELNIGPEMEPEDNVFKSIWDEYERVILQSLVTSFGLDFLVHDQHGGDVDTIHNVRKIAVGKDNDPDMKFKNSLNQAAYEARGEYTDELKQLYHGKDETYKKFNKLYSEQKEAGTLIDAYTGKKVARNAKIELDHVVATEKIHNDPGRVLAGLSVNELANTETNLKPTDRSINRSMQETPKEEYIKKHEEKSNNRKERIEQLRSLEKRTDKERKELEKLEKLDQIDPRLVLDAEKKVKKENDAKIARAYYTSKRFVKDTAVAATKRGAEMGVREALGFVFIEVWMCTKEEMLAVPDGSSLEDMLNAVGNGIQKGFESVKVKYKEIVAKIGEGFSAGALASLTTTLCNIFFTTAKNLVRCIRQMYASIIQAGRVLLFNPDNKMLGDRIKTATVILATGASVVVGTTVGSLIMESPIGKTPGIGPVVSTFCSSLVSGFLSCTLLLALDRSKFINDLVDRMNSIPSDDNNFKEIADVMEALAAKIANLDIEKFKDDTEKFEEIADGIVACEDDTTINNILRDAYDKLGIQIPCEGDFDSFMANKGNRLVFG